MCLNVYSCIDGYSQKILWLKCAHTNHQPGVITSFFLDCVEDVGGYPATLRTDCGTENTMIAAIQRLVSGRHIYGTSPGNQRIDSWWAFYRRQQSQWWIDVFESLVSSGSFHPGNTHETDCLRFCFMSLIQTHLDNIRRQWNTHRIRPSAGATCPAGVPYELYYLPGAPAADRLIREVQPLADEVLQQDEQPCTCYDDNLEAYLHYLRNFSHLPMPSDTESAIQLYRRLSPFMSDAV